MKAGETYVCSAPGDAHIHGHRYTLTREIPNQIVLGGAPLWESFDVDTGEVRAWAREHFEGVLALEP